MFSPITQLWNSVLMAGNWAVESEREKKSLILLNRSWLIMTALLVFALCSHMAHGFVRPAQLTFMFIVAMAVVHLLMRKGLINYSKITALVVINYSITIMAVLLGPQTHVINYLLLTALMPLYLFESEQRKLILLGVVLSILPYAIYQYSTPLISGHTIPVAEQMRLYNAGVWIRLLSTAALLYLMYSKNTNYETEVHKTEEQLRGQKKLYESVLEQLPVNVVTFDKELKYTFVNSSAISDPEMRKWMIGKTNSEYFKKRDWDVNVAKNRDRLLLEALDKGGKIETEETYIDSHGKPYSSIKGSCPVYDEDSKELLCIIGYSVDISGIKQAEKRAKDYAIELERRNEDLQQFANAASHDLKTPLRSIASYLQLLERKNADKLCDDSKGLISYVVSSVKHLNTLIGDIYSYSVADRNDRPVELTDLNKVLESVIKESSGVIDEKNAVVTYPELPELLLAPSHIQQVFSNLVGNGIKYNSSAHPLVAVEYTDTETEYIFTVADNGIGVPAEYNRQIFEIFRRLHTSDVYEGTGVGLAICKKIVENYGGRIWVETRPGGGSAFNFSLSKALVCPKAPMVRTLPEYNQLGITG